MTNKYDSYESEIFTYEYPIKWSKRNKNYLKKVYDRKRNKEYIIPIVFRMRFYLEDELISDKIYSPNSSTIRFPIPDEIEGQIFIGWKFLIGEKEFCVTSEEYTDLKNAVMSGEDDIVLTAYYEDI